MKYLIIATNSTLPMDRNTRYWCGADGWSPKRENAMRLTKREAVERVEAMRINPAHFYAENMIDIAIVAK